MVRLSTKAMLALLAAYIRNNCKFYKYWNVSFVVGFTIIGHQVHHFDNIKSGQIIQIDLF